MSHDRKMSPWYLESGEYVFSERFQREIPDPLKHHEAAPQTCHTVA
ncbi:MAG: hypothetical protein KDA89_18205 [Planctomycetaceae bacterium]|nr:hypothetical protein [Planctomycetaceae bacterium]